MASITTRQTAGTGATVNNAPLTNAQVDTNFINLNVAKAETNQTMFIGTTSVAINRASASLALTGITSIDGNAATVTNGITTGNYNSYSPTLTGTGASGTWSINVTGNAGSATTQAKTSATTVPASTAFSKWLFATTSTSGTLDWNDSTNTIPGVGTTLLLGTATNGPGGSNYYHPFNIEYSDIGGAGNVTQMGIAYGSPGNELYMRGRYQGTWSGWVRYLNSNNYNSYSPTLTGTGASGTWGISITGNATYATNSSKLYSTDAVYAYGSANPYYGYLTYNSTANRWTFKVSPATPDSVEVAYATNAGTASNATTVASLTPAQFFNNMGNNHSTYTDFNSVPNYGAYYLQGGTNSPTGTVAHQWYGFTLGLGNDYTLANYASQLYWPRRAQNSDTYVYVRDREGGGWTSWNKIKAGYADSAGTATSADQIDGIEFRNTASNSGINADTLDSNGVTYYTGGVTNFTGNATDGALYSQAYSAAWQHQIAGDYRSGQIAVRGKNSGTWQGWRTVLDSSNYNSYSPTLTGVGASGTWSINVTGSAATASTASTASYSNNITQGFNSNWNTDFSDAPAGSTILRGDTSSGSSSNGPGGTWWFQQNMRHTNSSNVWGVQVAWGWEDNAHLLRTRNVTGGSWSGWVTYLNSNNYNSYAPTLTGGNASGTWGINVTGSAGGVAWGNVSSKPSNIMFYEGFTLDANTMTSNSTGFTYASNAPYTGPVARFSAGSSYDLWLNAPYSGGGNALAFRTRNGDAGTLNAWRGILLDTYNSSLNSDTRNSRGVTRLYRNDNDSDYSVQTYWTGTYWRLYGYNGDSGHADTHVGYSDSSGTAAACSGNAATATTAAACSGNAATATTAARATRANGNFYIDDNYGNGVVGVYASTRYQGVFAMGDSYKLPADGTTTGSLYGLAWSYPGGQGGPSGNLDSHGLLVLINGGFGSAMSYSIVASGNVTAYSDERLKTNWRSLPDNFVTRLAKVKHGIYDRTDNEKLTQVGVSAQSLQALLPSAVTTATDDMRTLSVSYGNAAMASAVELAIEVVDLRERVAKLEQIINNLVKE